MKKLSCRWFLVMLLLCSSCLKDATSEAESIPEDDLLTAPEARAFFEQQLSLSTRSAANHAHFLPDDFTPLWDRAASGHNGRVCRVDIPIVTAAAYRAVRSEYVDCAARPYYVNVTLKLVVLRSVDPQKPISQYLMMLIPDRAYFAKRKNAMQAVLPESDQARKFSGYALYYQLGRNTPAYISRYADGRLVQHLGLLNKQAGYAERVKQMRQIFSSMRLQKTRTTIRTRMDGAEEEADVCPNCQSNPCSCSACPNCNADPCSCSANACPLCNSAPCACPPVEPPDPIDPVEIEGQIVCPNCHSTTCVCRPESCPNCWDNPCQCGSITCTACGHAPCQCPGVCPNCSSPTCSGECSSGGGGTPPPEKPKPDPKPDPTPNTPPMASNKNLNDALKNVLEKLGDSPLGKALQGLLNKFKINFTPASGITGVAECTMSSAGVIFKFDAAKINKGSLAANTMMCVHECYHIYRHQVVGSDFDNDSAHNQMINDPNYENWLKQAVPGFTDAEYDLLIYAGTPPSPVWDNLSEAEKKAIRDFCDRKGFYY